MPLQDVCNKECNILLLEEDSLYSFIIHMHSHEILPNPNSYKHLTLSINNLHSKPITATMVNYMYVHSIRCM